MLRREFVAGLGALTLGVAGARAGIPTTVAGSLTRLTPPGTGDNRATYLPDGTALRKFDWGCATDIDHQWRERRFLTARSASDDISQFAPRRISGFGFQAW